MTNFRAPRDVGDLVHYAMPFRVGGIFADPTTVMFRAKNLLTGAITQYLYGVDAQLVKDSVGNYHVDWTFPSAGAWVIHWQGTGTVAVSEQVDEMVQADATA